VRRTEPVPNATAPSRKTLPVALALGLLLGWFYARTRSLALCVGAHAFVNALSFLKFGLPFTVKDDLRAMRPRRLDLHLLCRASTPVRETLDVWPLLPIIVRKSGRQRRGDNIVAALECNDRISQLGLNFPRSQFEEVLAAMQEPFPALECIRITVKNAARPPGLSSGPFLGGSAPRLKEIKLDGVAFPFPTIRQVLSSAADNLVELCLSNIPNVGYFSPDALASSLSTLLQLKQLNIDFHSPSSRPPSKTCPPPQRVILPSLSILNFHGASEYLEEFVARINLPALYRITIRLFTVMMSLSKFCSSTSSFLTRTD